MKTKALNYLFSAYKAYKQSHCNTTLEHCIQSAKVMRNKAKYCFLISQSDKGFTSSRLVQPIFTQQNKSDTYTVCIGALLESRKVDEIWNNPHVTLAFENKAEDAALVIYGEASIKTDLDIKKQCWQSAWQMFFTGGVEADNYAVIQIKPSRMEILNFKRNITPEPFGLKSITLVHTDGQWALDN